MKLFKNRNTYSKYDDKIFLISSFIIFILAMTRPIIFESQYAYLASNSGYKLSNFDVLCSFENIGVLDFNNYMFIIIPLFMIVMIYLLNKNNSLVYVARFKSRSDIWYKRTRFSLKSSFILSVILVIGSYLVSLVMLGGFQNEWNTINGIPYIILGNTEQWAQTCEFLVSYKILLIFLITTFLGLMFLSTLLNILRLIFSSVMSYIIMISILLIEYFKIVKFPIIMGICMKANDWLNIESIIFKYLYFGIGILIMVCLGAYISEKKDQFVDNKKNVWGRINY